MADNKTTTTTVSTIPSGTVIATDEIGGVDYQRVKLACGPDGTATDVPVGGGVEAAALRVTIASDSTGVLSIDDNGSTISVDDGAGSLTVDNATISVVGSGTEATAQRVTIATDSTGVLSVDDNGGSLTVDVGTALPAGTNAIGKLAANTGVTIGAVEVAAAQTLSTVTTVGTVTTVSTLTGGGVAHGSADSGNPHKIGGKARTTNPTAEADGDRVDAMFDSVGRLVVVQGHVRGLTGDQVTTISNSTTETTIVTAGGAGVLLDLTHLTITNATATAVVATLRDDTAGTIRGIYAIPASGGIVLPFAPAKAQAAANKPWSLQLSALSITVYVVAHYVKNV